MIVSQQFRRDISVKGPLPLSGPAARDKWLDLSFALTVPANEVPRKVTASLGEAELRSDIYDPILAKLDSGPKSLRELMGDPVIAAVGWNNVLAAWSPPSARALVIWLCQRTAKRSAPRASILSISPSSGARAKARTSRAWHRLCSEPASPPTSSCNFAFLLTASRRRIGEVRLGDFEGPRSKDPSKTISRLKATRPIWPRCASVWPRTMQARCVS